MRVAAIDKRLEVYQYVYASINKMFCNIMVEKYINYDVQYFTYDKLLELHSFLDKNILYLTSSARNHIYTLIELFSKYIGSNDINEKDSIRFEIVKCIFLTFKLFMTDVELPSIGREDFETFEKLSKFIMAIGQSPK
jgi:hypothetical protein